MNNLQRAAPPPAEASVAHPWDAELFLRFEAERAWPARDLVSRIEGAPRLAFDLGCGPGTSTRLLRRAFPRGGDHPASTLRSRCSPRRGDACPAWRSSSVGHRAMAARASAPDLIFADSALQWVADHEALFPRLMVQLAEGGTLAVQMPDNRQEPSHALMRLIAADGPWADRLVPIAKTRAVIATHVEYYNWLRPARRPRWKSGRRPTSIRSRASTRSSTGSAVRRCCRSSRR